ncbi:MAG: hypothetical protein COA40_13540 [Aequorivita sp.]|nr:MAG: hypothetical protein COA40_13540 [Aequorivita sp.]
MKHFFPILLICFSLNLSAQSVTCEDLMDFIETEGMYSSSVSSYTLDSSWLSKVTLYSYDMNYFVVAHIKTSEFSYASTPYIFCGIPYRNWLNFKNGSYGDTDSYGERFHKYIFNYQCDCK